ncbi:helix-turn-helix domain-containing protein [Rhizobium laguerreae]|uniref:helix-turn-helix domain-containing protein n=1 Tax=Rhizobium laguerreae TaxID=1076926 RepID=UPI001C921A4C|nr:helix-turn-helix domain-containing protein [Rhizobium laguerreae]MBY3306178.1 helix-turn-helix domain-containing protein [Rhizobium laguerreae]
MQKPANDNLADDVLEGAVEIAAFLKLKSRQVYTAISAGHLPHYRIGSNLFARKSTLLAWIASQEGAAA